ncbi:serine hydrolase [Thalassotalea montiporae]
MKRTLLVLTTLFLTTWQTDAFSAEPSTEQKSTLATLPYQSFAQSKQTKQVFDQLVQQARSPFSLPFGTSIAVIKGDQVIYQGSFGYQDIAAERIVEPNTKFYIASVTKPIFALNALLSEHQGELNTKATLAALFPTLKFSQIDTTKVNTQHLLSHTSGLDGNSMVWPLAYTGLHNSELRKLLIAQVSASTESQLGEFDYTNLGYTMLSQWYEQTLKTPWQESLNRQIFTPLKMTASSATLADNPPNKKPYALPYSSSAAIPEQPIYLMKTAQTMHAAGGVISSTQDLARFVIAQLNQGQIDGQQVFPPEVISKSHQPLVQVPNPKNKQRVFSRDAYGWGWYIGKYQAGEQTFQVLHHNGGYPGASAHLSFLPEQNLGVVILNNEGRLGDALNKHIADAIYRYLLSGHAEERLAILNDLHTSIQKLASAFNGFVDKVSTTRQARQSQPLKLTLPLASYAGTYHHQLAGDIEIKVKKNRLNVSWGILHANAEAYDKANSVRLELVPEMGKVMQFSVNDKKVSQLTFADMQFTKI